MLERQLLEVHKYVDKYVCHKNPFLAKAFGWGEQYNFYRVDVILV